MDGFEPVPVTERMEVFLQKEMLLGCAKVLKTLTIRRSGSAWLGSSRDIPRFRCSNVHMWMIVHQSALSEKQVRAIPSIAQM
jgi:hypothetical protein